MLDDPNEPPPGQPAKAIPAGSLPTGTRPAADPPADPAVGAILAELDAAVDRALDARPGTVPAGQGAREESRGAPTIRRPRASLVLRWPAGRRTSVILRLPR
jgi:hypothetical protein